MRDVHVIANTYVVIEVISYKDSPFGWEELTKKLREAFDDSWILCCKNTAVINTRSYLIPVRSRGKYDDVEQIEELTRETIQKFLATHGITEEVYISRPRDGSCTSEPIDAGTYEITDAFSRF